MILRSWTLFASLQAFFVLLVFIFSCPLHWHGDCLTYQSSLTATQYIRNLFSFLCHLICRFFKGIAIRHYSLLLFSSSISSSISFLLSPLVFSFFFCCSFFKYIYATYLCRASVAATIKSLSRPQLLSDDRRCAFLQRIFLPSCSLSQSAGLLKSPSPLSLDRVIKAVTCDKVTKFSCNYCPETFVRVEGYPLCQQRDWTRQKGICYLRQVLLWTGHTPWLYCHNLAPFPSSSPRGTLRFP